ncbi:MAG: hypothetical protein PVJ57_22740 [Phycisphaerae bacterium]|jgi:hypothetical protein
MARVIRGQIPRLGLHARDAGRNEIPSLTIGVSQHAASLSVWRLRVDAVFDAQGVTRTLGSFETIPPGLGARPQSIAAIASAPGARQWLVQVEWVSCSRDGGPAADGRDSAIDVDLAAHDDCCCRGLLAIDGAARLEGERYVYLAATLAGGVTAVPVAAGVRVHTVSAFQIGAGGTVIIAGGPAAPLPPNGSLQLAPRGTVVGPVVVTFVAIPVGGGGYVIEGTR